MASSLVATALIPPGSAGQGVSPAPTVSGPLFGEWEPIRSLGQPPRWKPSVGMGFGVDREGGEAASGVTGTASVHRDLTNPVGGLLGVAAEVYLGQRGSSLDLGLRGYLESPLLFLQGGVDWNARRERADFVLSVALPVQRGGWFRRGGLLRIDWIPGRDHALVVGARVPVRQPLSGRTRPVQTSIALPRAQAPDTRTPLPPDHPADAPLEELRDSMEWITLLHNIFLLTERSRLSPEETVSRSRSALAEFREELRLRERRLGDRGGYEGEVAHYHRILEEAFRRTGSGLRGAGASGPGGAERLATLAREVALEEVVLPYNRTVGRKKRPDLLDGLIARARARFVTTLALEGGAAVPVPPEVLAVFDGWMAGFEEIRRQLASRTEDTRMQWLPLALALPAEEHVTQAQVEAFLERASERRFVGGNATHYVRGPRFHDELLRSILQAESFHLLWVHDYQGRDAAGDPDRTAFRITAEGYLRALLEAVRRHDDTGSLPVYVLMLDQYFAELNDARLWLDLLEDPLGHRFRVPEEFGWMQERVEALQDSLRAAVAASVRLQAGADAFGSGWPAGLVKVHVNVTFPADFAFRSRQLVRLPVGSDNLMRDHRKIVLRDLDPGDPGRGELILAGLGVGDSYASPTWEDRAMLVQGPGALPALAAAREVLVANGLPPERLPRPLREAEGVRPPDPAAVAALEAGGATARILQVHNGVGWNEKEATFLQMLLYDLAPPGTVLYVPDYLWTSYEWMAQLVSAALRGCRVYVVAAGPDNAPDPGLPTFPQMSAAQELLTRLAVVGEELGEFIREAGGDLRVGIYDRRSEMDDLPGLIREMEEAFREHPFLEELFPLGPAAREVLAAFGARERTRDPSLVEDSRERRPQLHRKTQLVVSGAVLERIGRSPDLPAVLADVLEEEFAARGEDGWEEGPLAAQERIASSLALSGLARSNGAGVEGVAYFLTGSMNRNVRSMVLDGEVLAAVSGPWALQPYLDFLLLSGTVRWVDGVEELESLFPPFGLVQRWVGRVLLRVL